MKICATAALLLLLATCAHSQDSQFLFDARGNLLVQTAEVTALPQILGQPQSQVAAPGEVASFSVVVTDTRALSYQWRFNGANLGGATGDALLLQNVGTINEGEYRVVLTNPSGSVTSAPALLMLDADGDGVPDSWELTYFTNLNQTATSDFDGDGVSNLQEFLDNTNPTNSASALYRIAVLLDGGAVSIAPTGPAYTNGEMVILTATSTAEDSFQGWTGDITSTNNPLTLVMTNNRTVFAHFGSYDITWTNLAGGNWHVPVNWSPNLIPDSDDNVRISSSVITLSGPAQCRDLSLGDSGLSPTLTGPGSLTVHRNATWGSGAMSGTGRTIIPPGVTLTVSASAVVLSRALENGGTFLWTAGIINMSNEGIITNRAGALFHVQNASTLGSGSGRFDNAGIFRKSGNPGTTTMACSFNNHGTVEIQTGALNLNAGGAHSGSFAVPDGTALILSGGTHTASGDSSIAGEGQFTVSGGTANLAGLIDISGSNTFGGGFATLTGNYICTNNTVTISGGTANFSGTGQVSPSVLNLSSGTLGGMSTVTVNSVMKWTGGTMSGSGRTIIPPGVTLTVGSSTVTLSRALENGGNVLWTGAGGITLINGVITNCAGALFHAQNAATMLLGGGAGRFDNAGIFRKSANPGITTASGVTFNNSGTVEIQTGTLLLSGSFTNTGAVSLSAGTTTRLIGGGSASGTFTAPDTALVEWTGGVFTLSTGAQLNGAALYKINAGMLTANADLIVENLDLNTGTLNGTGKVTVNHAMNWTAGTMSGTGRTIIPPGATLDAANSSVASLTTRTLENGGTFLWTGAGNISLNNAVITNRTGALFHVQNAATLSFVAGACRLDNAGTFRKSAHTGTMTVGSGVSFNNFGLVEIRSGILAANGGYLSSSNALLNCALGGTTVGTGYGQLRVAGTVTLNGALSVDLLPGFTPATNDAFTVVTAGNRSGTFADFIYPSNVVTMQISNSPTSAILRVTGVLAVIPQPMLLPPELFGTEFKLTWTAVSNAIYRVEFNPNLAPSNWNALPGDVIGVSNTASKLDLLTSSNRVYRVRLVP